MTTYVTAWHGTQLGIAFGGDAEIELIERNDLFRWGNQSRFAIIQADGEPCGNLFVARKGTVVFYLIVSGIYFDDGGVFSELVSSALSNAQRLRRR